MINKIGWMSAFFTALCGAPEAYRAVTTGGCPLTWTFLIMWGLGEIGAVIYTLSKNKQVKLWPLIFSYGLNIIFVTTMVAIKLL